MPGSRLELVESEPQDDLPDTLRVVTPKQQKEVVQALSKRVLRLYTTDPPNPGLKVPPVLHAPPKAIVRQVLHESEDPR